MDPGQGSTGVAVGAERSAADAARLPRAVLPLAGLLGLALLYFGAARLGLSLAITTDQVTAVWPPTGIALAAVLLFGFRVWPAIALGAFAANVLANEPVPVACGVALGNSLEAVCGAWLVRRAVGAGHPLRSLRGVVAWVGGAALLGSTVAATIGVTSLCAGGVQPWSAFGPLWWLWWLGDATGALLVGSPLLAWSRWQRPAWDRRRLAEALALAASVGVMGILIFGGPGDVGSVGHVGHSLVYGMIPIVCWAALRFGPPGVTAVSGVAAGFAIWLTSRGSGPFAMGDVHGNLMLLAVFSAVVSATGLFLAGADADRRGNERALRESELRYSSVVEAVPGMLWTCRPDGECDFVNQAYYDFTGRPAGSALGRGWAEALHPDDVPRTSAKWLACVASGEPFEMEFRMREYDGNYRWFTSRGLPVRDGKDRILMWVGACIDIDTQKQAEQRLREDERRKDQFLAGLGDELRDPLAPIRFAVQALDAREPAEPETRRMAGLIEREVGQMASLIDDLLEVSRIAQGRTRLHREPCDLSVIAAAAVERCRGGLERQQVRLSVEVPDAPLRMLADPQRLAQVVDHVLRSAASLTDPGGTVALRLSADADGRGARLVVRHPGIGLEPQVLARLFEHADPLAGVSGGRRGGLGLGLVLVRSLVELHGGRILRSHGELAGSSFGLWLPLREAQVASQPPGMAAQA